jgi:hypothetical protein
MRTTATAISIWPWHLATLDNRRVHAVFLESICKMQNSSTVFNCEHPVVALASTPTLMMSC